MKVGVRTRRCLGSAIAVVFALAGRARADQSGSGNVGGPSDPARATESTAPSTPSVDHVSVPTEPPRFDPESDAAKRAREEARKHPAPVPPASTVRAANPPARPPAGEAAANHLESLF